mmetsp:Transcript_14419/g.36765  ORF Transcript_14419/g.36765 Transcript_14419/m.36765 type:complete len:251 (-) Transcript_14419:549-1301(-)
MEAAFTEKLLYFPRSYYAPGHRYFYGEQISRLGDQCTNLNYRHLCTRSFHGIPTYALAIGVFSNRMKLSRADLNGWVTIAISCLKSNASRKIAFVLPPSPPYGLLSLKHQLNVAVEEAGVASWVSVIVLEKMPEKIFISARSRLVDVVIDSLSHNGHSTTMDSIASGIPVVTWPGITPASRVSASLLLNASERRLVRPSYPSAPSAIDMGIICSSKRGMGELAHPNKSRVVQSENITLFSEEEWSSEFER